MLRLTLFLADPNFVPRSIFQDLPLTPLSNSGPTFQADFTVALPHGAWAPVLIEALPVLCPSGTSGVGVGAAGSWSGIACCQCLFPEHCQLTGPLRGGGLCSPVAWWLPPQDINSAASAAFEHAAWCQSGSWSSLTQALYSESTFSLALLA